MRPLLRLPSCWARLICLLLLALPVSLAARPLAAVDTDGDGTDDHQDSCVAAFSVSQADTDGDQYGNICDCDFDNDASCGIQDFNLFLPDFSSSTDAGAGTDMNSDGSVGIADFNEFLKGFVAGTPGPSGFVPDGDGDGISVAGGDCNDGDPNQHFGASVVDDPTTATPSPGICFAARGPDGTDPRDTDGCSASALTDVLDDLGFPLPPDPQTVKNDPLAYFTGGACSAPFGNGDALNGNACELHDACYSVCGEDRALCDIEFFNRLTETCHATFLPGNACLNPCLLLADTYAIHIALADDEGYLKDQDLRCTCCPDTSACGDGTCDLTIGEGAANCTSDCGAGPYADGSRCVTARECASNHCSFQGECTTLVCISASDCDSGLCNLGTCLSRPLENTANCTSNAACDSGVCNFGFCIAGGLPAASLCTTDAACRSGDCFGGICEDVCGDGFCDGLEKCGDANAGFECNADCNTCSNGAICINNSDCTSGVCNIGFCINGGLPAASPCTTDAACRSGDCFGGLCEDICGDGFCDGLEKCGDANAGLECNADCGKCSNGAICISNNDCTSSVCNFGICINGNLGNGAVCSTDSACSSGNCLAGICAPAQFCGDLSCNNGETCSTCAIDCGVCPFCGDFSCNGGETCSSCSFDCGACCSGSGAVCVFNGDCCSNDCNFGFPPRCG